MPYCERCLTEYVAGTQRCEDCGAVLAPGSPPEVEESQNRGTGTAKSIGGLVHSLLGSGNSAERAESRTVRIRTFSGPTALLDADLARNLLQAQRIPSVLPGAASVEMLPFLEVPLLVREEDAERAKAILKGYFDQLGPTLVK